MTAPQPGSDPDRRWDLEDQIEIFASELADLYGRERRTSMALQRHIDELRSAQVHFARAFALVIEGNDPDTRAHLDRTTRWATAVSQEMGLDNIHELQLGFLLHDIGKWMVPKEILNKPGPLDDHELRVMRTHPIAGVQMIQDVEILRPAFAVIRCHHEKWDGSGYPSQLAGEDIPLPARIFAVADVFDALTADRPYRKRAFTLDEAIEVIRQGRGTHFDAEVAEIFLDIVVRLEAERLR